MAQAVYSLENEGAMSNWSRFAVGALPQQAGFTKVSNLTGGITAWAGQIDSKMPKY